MGGIGTALQGTQDTEDVSMPQMNLGQVRRAPELELLSQDFFFPFMTKLVLSPFMCTNEGSTMTAFQERLSENVLLSP